MGVKDFLKKQTSIPESIEKQLPENAPKISEILYTVADSLPDLFGLNTNNRSNRRSTVRTPRLREFIGSVEEQMPTVFPKFVSESCSECDEKLESRRATPAARSRAGYGVDKRGTILLTDEGEQL